jgi:hypothetical protein
MNNVYTSAILIISFSVAFPRHKRNRIDVVTYKPIHLHFKPIRNSVLALENDLIMQNIKKLA